VIAVAKQTTYVCH